MQLKCMLIFLYKLSRLKRLEVIAFESFVSLKQTVKGEVGFALPKQTKYIRKTGRLGVDRLFVYILMNVPKLMKGIFSFRTILYFSESLQSNTKIQRNATKLSSQYKWTMTQNLMYEHSEQFEDQEEESAAVSKSLTWFHRLWCCKDKTSQRRHRSSQSLLSNNFWQ